MDIRRSGGVKGCKVMFFCMIVLAGKLFHGWFSIRATCTHTKPNQAKPYHPSCSGNWEQGQPMLNNLAFNLFAVDILDVLVLMILHHKKMFLRFFTVLFKKPCSRVEWFWNKIATLSMLRQIVVGPQFQNFMSQCCLLINLSQGLSKCWLLLWNQLNIQKNIFLSVTI